MSYALFAFRLLLIVFCCFELCSLHEISFSQQCERSVCLVIDCVVLFDLQLSSVLIFVELALNCTLTGCQDNCAVTRSGPMCYCKSGYEISQDGKNCKGRLQCTHSHQHMDAMKQTLLQIQRVDNYFNCIGITSMKTETVRIM